MLDLISIGDIKLDTFVSINQASVHCQLKERGCKLCIDYGAKIPVDLVDTQIAGTAPNVAVGLARLGLKTSVMSNMGPDGTHKLAIERLGAEGVSTKHIRVVPGAKSSYAVIFSYRGESTNLTSHIKQPYPIPKTFPKTKWIYLGEMGHGYEQVFRAVHTHIKSNKIKFGFNPGSVQIAEHKPILMKLIAETEVLFVNRKEARELCGQKSDDVLFLSKTLFDLGPRTVVITDGRDGAYSFDGMALTHAPMFPGERTDATGAGDAFATGYLGALLTGYDGATGLAWGSVNSASVVQHVGPQPGLLTQAKIKRLLKVTPSYHVTVQ